MLSAGSVFKFEIFINNMIIKLVLVVTLFCYCGLAQQNETEISLDEVIDQVFKSTTESILDIIKPFEERPSVRYTLL